MNEKGLVFNVQRFSLHDGPGIRTLVFLKGCPLRCRWCSNPESINRNIEILNRYNRCIGCGLCMEACPEHAISRAEDGRYIIDRKRCTGCGDCARVCPTGSKSICGQWYTVDEVMEMVKRDKPFYVGSGGGLSLSGGEILAQAPFAHALLKRAHEMGVNTAIETSACGDWNWLSQIIEQTDTVHMDIKAIDPALHKRITGVDNRLVLENIVRTDQKIGAIKQAGGKKRFIVRFPMIPGYNDSEENIEQTAEFVLTHLKHYDSVEILPFHNMGEQKYAQLDQFYELVGRANTKVEDIDIRAFLAREIPIRVSKW